jgi:hypothetical protein
MATKKMAITEVKTFHHTITTKTTDNNKGVYKGEVKKGTKIKHGRGTYIIPSTCTYEGQWQNDKKHGQGLQTWYKGSRYFGGWQNDRRHGQGTYVWEDGSKYKGDWLNGKKHGQGTFVWTNTGNIYKGGWHNDLKHGYGTKVNADGSGFTGHWKNGKIIDKQPLRTPIPRTTKKLIETVENDAKEHVSGISGVEDEWKKLSPKYSVDDDKNQRPEQPFNTKVSNKIPVVPATLNKTKNSRDKSNTVEQKIRKLYKSTKAAYNKENPIQQKVVKFKEEKIKQDKTKYQNDEMKPIKYDGRPRNDKSQFRYYEYDSANESDSVDSFDIADEYDDSSVDNYIHSSSQSESDSGSQSSMIRGRNLDTNTPTIRGKTVNQRVTDIDADGDKKKQSPTQQNGITDIKKKVAATPKSPNKKRNSPEKSKIIQQNIKPPNKSINVADSRKKPLERKVPNAFNSQKEVKATPIFHKKNSNTPQEAKIVEQRMKPSNGNTNVAGNTKEPLKRKVPTVDNSERKVTATPQFQKKISDRPEEAKIVEQKMKPSGKSPNVADNRKKTLKEKVPNVDNHQKKLQPGQPNVADGKNEVTATLVKLLEKKKITPDKVKIVAKRIDTISSQSTVVTSNKKKPYEQKIPNVHNGEKKVQPTLPNPSEKNKNRFGQKVPEKIVEVTDNKKKPVEQTVREQKEIQESPFIDNPDTATDEHRAIDSDSDSSSDDSYNQKSRNNSKLQSGKKRKMKYDVFLSHNWGSDKSNRDNHKRVVEFNNQLRKEGIQETRFDKKQMTGDVKQKIRDEIVHSRFVIFLVTSDYIQKVMSTESDNCRFEFKYATKNKTSDEFIVVVMEDECSDPDSWEGPVGIHLGGQLYYSYKRDAELKVCARDVAAEISRRMEPVKETESKVALDEIRGLLSARSPHLPGYDWFQDWVQWMQNNHPLIGLCYNYKENPIGIGVRVMTLIVSLANASAVANFVYLHFLNFKDDHHALKGVLQLTIQRSIIWTVGASLHALVDLTIWQFTMPLFCRESYGRWFTYILWIICLILSLTSFINRVNAYTVFKNGEDSFYYYYTGNDDEYGYTDDQKDVNANIANENAVDENVVESIFSGSYLVGYLIELFLSYCFYYPFLATMLLFVLPCCFCGRQREIERQEERTFYRDFDILPVMKTIPIK